VLRALRSGWSRIGLAGTRSGPRARASHVLQLHSARLCAERFYDCTSVVWVSVPDDTCGEVLPHLVRLGYGRIVAGATEPLDPAGVLVTEVLDLAVWLVPGVMSALRASSDAMATAYALVLANPEVVGTVQTWNRVLGHCNRRAIGRLQREAGVCVSAWTMLAYLRLLAGVDSASRRTDTPTAAEIARRFGYSSGTVLARHAERTTGRAFRELLEMGPERMLALVPGTEAGGQKAPGRGGGATCHEAGGACPADATLTKVCPSCYREGGL
jgi:hypothetical protein